MASSGFRVRVQGSGFTGWLLAPVSRKPKTAAETRGVNRIAQALRGAALGALSLEEERRRTCPGHVTSRGTPPIPVYRLLFPPGFPLGMRVFHMYMCHVYGRIERIHEGLETRIVGSGLRPRE